MTHSVNLSDATFMRLQAHAVPLVDTIETVINRVLDTYEAGKPPAPDESSYGARVFNPAGPPNLAHTKVLSVELCGRRLPPPETNWNALLVAMIREAAKRLGSAEQIKDLVIVNCVLGRKEEDGYKFLPDVGLSLQGQDSNGAWKAAYHIAKNLGLPISVTFVWFQNEKAVLPGATGRFSVTTSQSAHVRRPVDMRRVDAIVERSASRPVLDSRTPDEIIGYDEFGIPG